MGRCCSDAAVAEGGSTPRPRPPRCVHRGPTARGTLELPGCGVCGAQGDGLGCSAGAWARTPDSFQLCRGCPHVPSGLCPLAGHAQSSRCYKYPGTGLPARPAGAGVLLKPNGLSLQLTLCVHQSPLCGLKTRNPPIRNV